MEEFDNKAFATVVETYKWDIAIILNYLNNRRTKAYTESFNVKIKDFLIYFSVYFLDGKVNIS